MNKRPTNWATIPVLLDEERCLYSNRGDELTFHATEGEARHHIQVSIECGGKMLALMEIKAVLVPKPVEVEEMDFNESS